MIEFSNTEVFNMNGALRGMRNPLRSWKHCDSEWIDDEDWDYEHGCANASGQVFIVGENDMQLAMKLRKAGSDHRKYLRQIFVCVDIVAPEFWWKEYSTYKVGTCENSTSTMHTIHKEKFTLDHFSHDHLSDHAKAVLSYLIVNLNLYRDAYLETKDKAHWYNIIESLPMSYLYRRTCTMNYENLVNMYHARKHHKLDEWHTFCEWVESLPYSELIIGEQCDE